jgi:glycosyltransferase involved in cell wall biosynthesis
MSAFDSVLSQKGVEIEYIVVDGGSDDGTVDIIREYAQRIPQLELQSSITFRWISERDAGMYDAINKGIKMATGDIVGILNADDRLADENVLATIVASFDSQVDCTYGDIRFVRGESLKTVRYYSSRPWRRWMHYWGYMPAHSSVYVRKEVFEHYGLYELGYDISADFEWMVRILCRNRIEARYLPHCLVTMRLGGKSTAGFKAMWKLNIENVRANRRNGYFCVLPMMLPKYLFKVLGYVFKKKELK